jgi:hypothetical protein
MHYILLLLLFSCSSEKKIRGNLPLITDNDERISHDWDGDGFPETVLISPISGPGKYRELVIYRGVPEGAPREIIFRNRNLIPRRARPGGSIRLNKDFSFSITVDSSASGRTGEVIIWKISWKKGRYLLTGLVRDWTDKLDPSDHKTCDVNLKRGRGSKNGKLIKFDPLTVDLIDLNDRFIPAICEF